VFVLGVFYIHGVKFECKEVDEMDEIKTPAMREALRDILREYGQVLTEREKINKFIQAARTGCMILVSWLLPEMPKDAIMRGFVKVERSGQMEVISLLLEQAGDLLQENNRLLKSLLRGNIEMHLAILHHRGEYYREVKKYVLWSIVEYGYPETIVLLIDQGAASSRALAAAARCNVDAVSMLLDRVDIRAGGDNALLSAVQNKRNEIISLLLDRGADIHAKKDGLLGWAVKTGSTEVLELLLSRGASIQAKKNDAIRLVDNSTQFREGINIACLLLAHRICITRVKNKTAEHKRAALLFEERL
jgi:hypothetical protein